MDFVDEQNFARNERGQHRCQVPRVIDGGTAGNAQRLARFVRDDHGEGGFSESRRSRQQNVVRGPVLLFGSIEEQNELFSDFALANKLRERLWPKSAFELHLAIGLREGGVSVVCHRLGSLLV